MSWAVGILESDSFQHLAPCWTGSQSDAEDLRALLAEVGAKLEERLTTTTVASVFFLP